jgi:hypothetical protein
MSPAATALTDQSGSFMNCVDAAITRPFQIWRLIWAQGLQLNPIQ